VGVNMKLTVTGRHISITEPIKNYSKDKLTNIVDKHLPRVTKAHIIMDVEKYRHLVEVELHGPQTNIYSKVSSRDMYVSIDKVMSKIERQLVKSKAKYDKRKQGRKAKIIKELVNREAKL